MPPSAMSHFLMSQHPQLQQLLFFSCNFAILQCNISSFIITILHHNATPAMSPLAMSLFLPSNHVQSSVVGIVHVELYHHKDKQFILGLKFNMDYSIDQYFGAGLRGERRSWSKAVHLGLSWFFKFCFQVWMLIVKIDLCLSVFPQGQSLIDNLQTMKFDLHLCCKVNIQHLLILVHPSTKCQI